MKGTGLTGLTGFGRMEIRAHKTLLFNPENPVNPV
jgi:hypothetical protein